MDDDGQEAVAVPEAPQQIGNPAGNVGAYTIDGKRFLFWVPAEQTAQAPFTVALNWEAGLKEQQ